MKMKINRIFIFGVVLLLLWSCLPNSYENLDRFYYLTTDLKTATNIKILANEYFNNDKVITSPPLTWISLVELTTTNGSKYCLNYKTPFTSNNQRFSGILKIVLMENDNGCSNTWFKESDKTVHIDELKIYYPNTKTTIEKVSLTARTLYLQIEKNKKKIWQQYPLYNIAAPSTSTPKRFSTHVPNTLIPFCTIALNSKNNSEKNTNLIIDQKFENNFADASSTPCHTKNETCQDIISFKCDTICKYGWYEVVTNRCANVNDKYCGINRCGEEHFPACPRGNYYDPHIKELPIDNTARGYCLKDLLLDWNSDGILICK